jgi:hypothetical protein
MTEKAEQVNPLPPPLNSGYNDLYYCTSYGESHHTLLVSNRPPAQSLNGTACCYDIFRVVPSKEAAITVSDSTQKSDHEHPLTSASDSTGIQMSEAEFLKLSAEQQVQFMNTRFPIRLYFDNDYPDPRSRKPTTESMVDSLCREYIGRKAAYLSAQFNADDQVSIEWFFRDSVQGHLNKLEEFTANLYRHLNQRNQSIVLTVKGTASPLAETRYNLILSERRIASLLNFWRSWNNGALAAYLDKGRLEVRFIPSGEDTKSKVSDQLSDQARSVYSLGAALERRIEIIRIEERKP